MAVVCTQLMTLSEKLLPKTLFEFIMKKTFYGQFIAGANSEEVIMLARRLAPSGIRFMPSPSAEDELEKSDSGGNKQNRFYLCNWPWIVCTYMPVCIMHCFV